MHPGGVASQVEERLEEEISVPTRTDPRIDLEEIDYGELVVRISATPVKREDGPALADQVVKALDRVHTAQQAG
jgi:hypothetical protein